MFRILIADNHPIFRLGLCTLLGSHERWGGADRRLTDGRRCKSVSS